MIRRWADHATAALPIVWLTVLFLVPVGFAVVFSFGHNEFGSVRLGFTLDNYGEALSSLYLETFLRTIVFAVGCSAICLVAGFPVAYAIARRGGRFARVALGLIVVPYLASFLVKVMAWQIILSRGGPLDALAHALGSPDPVDLLDTPVAVVIGTVYVYLPIAVIAMTIVLERIPTELLQASRDLGASPASTFRHVTLPLARPGIATAALLTAVPMLGELVIPQLLGGGKGLLMGQAIATQYGQSQNYALGSAMVVLLVLAVGVLVAILVRLTRGFDRVTA
jgi:ABC-type spermidine/putrescine transport system permease subunit I